MPRLLHRDLPHCPPLTDLLGSPGLRGPVTFLDSANPDCPGVRWSILAEAPCHTLIAKDGALLVDGAGALGDPLALLGGLHRARSFKTHLPPGAPWPGAVVALSYDLKDCLEPATRSPQSGSAYPDIVGYFFDMWVVEDHQLGTRQLLGYEHDQDGSFIVRFEDFANRLAKAEVAKGKSFTVIPGDVTPNEDRYLEGLTILLEGMKRGDWYQANFTRSLRGTLQGEKTDLYHRLRRVSPAPFGAYMEFGHQAILSASPECFLRVRAERLETRPIKGTRPRSRDAAMDSRLQQTLLASPKDDAELTMIVDLCRNDLARVCVPGSVRAVDLKRLESHAGVHHPVATVAGHLPRPWRLEDLIRATFPAGSITGAPKIAAMKILGRLEPAARGFYTGSLLLLDAAGDLDSNVLIRTILCDHDRVSFQVGGGIVIDSDPAAELQETWDKAATLLEALGLTQEDFAREGSGG